MKLLLFLFCAIPAFGFTQYGPTDILGPYTNNPDYMISNRMAWFIQETIYSERINIEKNKVESLQLVRVRENGKKKVVQEKKFDQSGRVTFQKAGTYSTEFKYHDTLISDIIVTGKGYHSHRHADYNANGKMVRVTESKNGKEIGDYNAEYDSEGRIIRVLEKENGKLRNDYRYVYYDKNYMSLVEHIYYGRKTTVTRIETEFDAILKKPTSARSFVNGELKQNWTYSCDDKGIVLPKDVDEVTSCSYEAQNNDGSFIKYTRTIRDGKVYLREVFYDKDSVCTGNQEFLNETILIYRYTVDGNKKTSEGFNDKGKLTYRYEYIYDDFGAQISWKRLDKHDKIKYGSESTYSDKHLIVRTKNLATDYHTDYLYTFY